MQYFYCLGIRVNDVFQEYACKVRDDFLPIYGKLKRDKFLSVLRDHPQASDKELKCIFKELAKKPEKKQEQAINFEQQ